MCGIAGILTTRADLDLEPILLNMRDALRHRGPDDEGVEQVSLPNGCRLGLAHTRLAILDLSPAGHQPMNDPESGSWIVYNGEVYNHADIRRRLNGRAFRSSGDTETILKCWVQEGERALVSLRGMFAFALYDGRRQLFWLVRDRLGVKPLYVSRAGQDTWLFASELRALLATDLISRRLRAPALANYLVFGAVTAPWTLLDDVQSLTAAECWRFDLSNVDGPLEPVSRRYWQPPFAGRAEPEPKREEALERLRPLLREASALRMVSDVPVAVFLSGGIDSSSVVGSLADQGFRLHTISVTFGERSFDESEYARLASQRFLTEHTELRLRADQVFEEFDRSLSAYDQPSIDGLNTYFISQAARQAGIKVALSGLGGDELFAAYPYFRLAARLERPLYRRLARLAHGVMRPFAPRANRTVKLGAFLEHEGSRVAQYAVCRQVLADSWRRRLSPAATAGSFPPFPPGILDALHKSEADLDTVNAYSLLELEIYLGNMLLRDLDQMSMAHALEVREPLLDHVLVEAVAGLPGRMKLASGKNGSLKSLLVDALQAELPPAIVRRRKKGFVFPWEAWLRNELKTQVEVILTEENLLKDTGLSSSSVRELWSDFLASRPGVRYTDVLALVHLAHWVRRNRLAL